MNDPIAVLPPMRVERGLNHGSSSECGKTEYLAPHLEQPPSFANTSAPAVKPGGAPFKLKAGGR